MHRRFVPLGSFELLWLKRNLILVEAKIWFHYRRKMIYYGGLVIVVLMEACSDLVGSKLVPVLASLPVAGALSLEVVAFALLNLHHWLTLKTHYWGSAAVHDEAQYRHAVVGLAPPLVACLQEACFGCYLCMKLL